MKTIASACLATLLALPSLCSCQQRKPNLVVEWDFSPYARPELVLDSVVLSNASGTLASTCELNDSLHAILEACVPAEPSLATLKVYATYEGKQDSARFVIIAEPGAITIDNDIHGAVGTPLNDAVHQLILSISELDDPENDAMPLISEFVGEHAQDAGSAFVLCDPAFLTLIEPADMNALYALCSDEVKSMPEMQMVAEAIEKMSRTAPGQPYCDFEAEYNGVTSRLSDYVGKGKYVIVDFWASWCGPCRREIPYLIKVYNTYKGEKFDVLGVATWDKPEDTEKAIAELGIPYPQIINAQRAGSDAYSIEGIPEIILFGPDGTILKRGLRGDDIENAVKECLGL